MPARFALVSIRPLAAILLASAAFHAAASPGAPFELPAVRLPQHFEIEIDTDQIVAQAKDAAQAAREVQRHMRDIALAERDLDFDPASLAFFANEFGGGTEIVKNAPYTAEAVSESVQVLADGNRIVKQTRTLLARDGYGRTRQEKKGQHGTTVYVFDPIEGKSFVMHPERRSAVRIPRVPAPPVPPLPPVPAGAPAPSSMSGTPAIPPVPPVPPAPQSPTARASRVEAGPGGAFVHREETRRGDDVRVEVVRLVRPEGAPLAPIGALTLPLLPRGKGETQSLGTRDFGGIKAEGTQTTHTIPAGEIGNEKPIVIRSERWFSPELHVVVFTKTVDPRVGETSYRLANLKREEPAADLFRVPHDYRMGGVGKPDPGR